MLFKQMLSSLLSTSGIYSLVERVCYSDKAFVLTYHRILSSVADQEHFVQPGMYVATSSFEKHMAFLRDRFEIVFLDDLLEKLLNGENVGGHCAITFDDGWRDNYTDAYPVLEKYRVPATIFLATGFIGTDRMFWPEELCCYITRHVGMRAFNDGPPSLITFNKEMSEHVREHMEIFLDSAIEILKKFTLEEREELLGYFRKQLGTLPLARQMLSWDEAREMLASKLVRFGSHTVNHEMLDKNLLEKSRDEIIKSREDIENNLGVQVSTFAYPNGNFTANIQKILIESGFYAAVTTRKGFLTRDIPLMEIPRIAIHEDVSNTVPMFRSRILLRKF